MSKSKAKTKSVEPKSPTKTTVYCGPSLRDVKQYDVFIGVLPEYVKKHFDNVAVKSLFVDIKDLSKVRKNIKNKGSREHQLYVKAFEYSRGGK